MGANNRSAAPLAYHNDCQAARFAFASRCARAFFPSLAATAMLSKKTGEDFYRPPPTSTVNFPFPCFR